jgi:hypothetical protein
VECRYVTPVRAEGEQRAFDFHRFSHRIPFQDTPASASDAFNSPIAALSGRGIGGTIGIARSGQSQREATAEKGSQRAAICSGSGSQLERFSRLTSSLQGAVFFSARWY